MDKPFQICSQNKQIYKYQHFCSESKYTSAECMTQFRKGKNEA